MEPCDGAFLTILASLKEPDNGKKIFYFSKYSEDMLMSDNYFF